MGEVFRVPVYAGTVYEQDRRSVTLPVNGSWEDEVAQLSINCDENSGIYSIGDGIVSVVCADLDFVGPGSDHHQRDFVLVDYGSHHALINHIDSLVLPGDRVYEGQLIGRVKAPPSIEFSTHIHLSLLERGISLPLAKPARFRCPPTSTYQNQ